MLGRANDTRADIYLSDGGHFDNLGVYEMLRRRCRIIVAIDAGCDPDYQYADLGAALRLAAIDFDINGPLHRADHQGRARPRCRRRLCQDQLSGRARTAHLLYLKPWLPQALPADVLAYFSTHADFPHQTTANQFFSESQFESYRALGELIVGNAFGGDEDAGRHGRRRRNVAAAAQERGLGSQE